MLHLCVTLRVELRGERAPSGCGSQQPCVFSCALAETAPSCRKYTRVKNVLRWVFTLLGRRGRGGGMGGGRQRGKDICRTHFQPEQKQPVNTGMLMRKQAFEAGSAPSSREQAWGGRVGGGVPESDPDPPLHPGLGRDQSQTQILRCIQAGGAAWIRERGKGVGGRGGSLQLRLDWASNTNAGVCSAPTWERSTANRKFLM